MMISDQPKVQVADGNDAFTISATGKAFKILSDGLYSDKITAVIRELSCNAYDSHVAAGKPDVPFEVHVPTDAEPWFSVEDRGLGISDADIHGIYTRYFSSTKTNSNEFIGQLGLGSKSPFSLVREFKVISRHAGQQGEYRMYFDASDTPRVETVSITSTAEPNGVLVRLDISSYIDRSRFREKAPQVLGWFKTVPTVMRDGSAVAIKPLAEGLDGWRLDLGASKGTGPVALMGNVAYPLASHSINVLDHDLTNLLELPLLVEFGIGELEVSASRESLGYDDRTCGNIVSKLTKVSAEVKQRYAKMIADAATEWQARAIHDEIFSENNAWRWDLKNLLAGFDLKWNGIIIHGKSKKVDLTKSYGTTIVNPVVYRASGGERTMRKVHISHHAGFLQDCGHRNRVLFNDVDRNGLHRIRHWLSSNKDSFEVTVFSKPDLMGWDELRGALGDPEVIMCSDLPVPPSAPKAVRAKMTVFTGNSIISRAWADVDVDLSAGGFWINRVNKKPVNAKGGAIQLREVLDGAVRCGIIPPGTKIYSPKGNMRGKLQGMPGWNNLIEHISKLINDKLISNTNNVDLMATRMGWSDMGSDVGCSSIQHKPWVINDRSGVAHRFMDLHDEIGRAVSGINIGAMNDMIKLSRMIGIEPPKGKPDHRIADMVKQFNDRYPMIGMVSGYRAWDHSFKQINDYVNMVDMAWVYFELSRPQAQADDETA